MMSAVMALNSIRFQIGMIVGPAVAGVIAATFSPAAAYAIDLVTFAATLIAVFMIRFVAPPENPERPSLQGVIKGIKYAFSRQELLGTYFIDIAAMFFAFPQALYPALAAVYGNEYVGFFPAALAIGALLASITSGWTKNIHRHGVMVIGAAVLWGVGILFFGMSTSLAPALFFLGVAGFFDMISGIFRGAIWNQKIPKFLRGRLAGIEMISYLTGPMLGSAKMGIVAEYKGVAWALISGGALCIVAVSLTALFLPRFWKYNGKDGIRQREIEEAERAEMTKLSISES
jgi:MFS family permease